MVAKVSKINIQKPGTNKKAKFDFSKDVSSTHGFGEVQPLMCRPCVTGADTVDFTINSLVRLSPLAVSTFGRIDYRITNHFVSMEDVYPSWKFVLGNQENYYDGANVSQIPFAFPTITQDFLMSILCSYPYSTYSLNIRGGTNTLNNDWQHNPITSGSSYYKLGLMFPNAHSNYFTPTGVINPATDIITYYSATNTYLTSEGADFNCFAHDNTSGGTSSDFLFLIKLTSKGKRLYKILTGLGYKLSFNSDIRMNLLPLLAFYKAYFDAYSLPQYQNWFDTSAYKLIKYLDNAEPSTIIDVATNPGSTNKYAYIKDFLDELSECWYSDAADFVSSCLPADGAMPGSEGPQLYNLKYTVNGVDHRASDFVSTGTQLAEGMPQNTAAFDTSNYLDQISDDVLKKLYLSIDRESAAGFDIKNRLLAKGYKSYVDDCQSHFLGKESIPIQISDVNATADTMSATGGSPLGAYTGKGIQYNESNHFSYSANEIGYVISLGVIVPMVSPVNALDPTLLGIDRYSFFNEDYDSLGYEPVTRAEIGHFTGTFNNEVTVNDKSYFGYHPRYTGFKVSPSNVLNGEFSLKSSRKSWLPYTLDQVIIENDSTMTANSFDPSTGKFKTNDSSTNAQIWLMPTAGQDWRYPTNNSWKGNFNRIFAYGETGYNSGNSWSTGADIQVNPPSDNFLVHNILECSVWSPMKAIADSYDTKDEDTNEDAGELTSNI